MQMGHIKVVSTRGQKYMVIGHILPQGGCRTHDPAVFDTLKN